jgi:hypothetical protein
MLVLNRSQGPINGVNRKRIVLPEDIRVIARKKPETKKCWIWDLVI